MAEGILVEKSYVAKIWQNYFLPFFCRVLSRFWHFLTTLKYDFSTRNRKKDPLAKKGRFLGPKIAREK